MGLIIFFVDPGYCKNVENHITYEHPLNERVRTFLRIEHLLDKVDYLTNQMNEWEVRSALEALIDIVDFLTRTDIKNELIKELEKSSNKLTTLKDSTGVDHQRLHLILDDINSLLTLLKDSSYQPGQIIRKSEFINSIRQRISIPGGSCSFDLPSYHHWLNTDREDKLRCFTKWMEDIQTIKRGIHLSLNMVRSSCTPLIESATDGFYQKSVEPDINYQLIRVLLSETSPYFPEISGGRQRFTIRFMQFNNGDDRPSQCDEDIQFELHCCVL